MNRYLLAATAFVLVAQVSRPRGEGPVAVTLREHAVTLDAASHVAVVHYAVFNRTFRPAYVPTDAASHAVMVEHELGGRWLIQQRLALTCTERTNAQVHDGLSHGQTCSGGIAIRVPGRYRIAVLQARARRGPWQPAISTRVKVSAIAAPSSGTMAPGGGQS